jgi:hypothetical protein
LVLNILTAVSQWEHEAIGDRTGSALATFSSASAYTLMGRSSRDPAEQAGRRLARLKVFAGLIA